VNVQQPGFDLNLTPAAATLGRGQSTQIQVATNAVLGDDRHVSVGLQGAPAGLQWKFTNVTVDPGVSTTLILTDTDLLAPGVYTMTVSGENGAMRKDRSLVLTVQKPSFTISATPALLSLQPGETRTVKLNVAGQFGWSGPVTLTVDANTTPDEATVAFLAGGGFASQVTVTPPQDVTLQVATTTLLPRQTYTLRVLAESGGQRQIVEIQINTDAHAIYMPVILSVWTIAP
jgi:hypothetical protein